MALTNTKGANKGNWIIGLLIVALILVASGVIDIGKVTEAIPKEEGAACPTDQRADVRSAVKYWDYSNNEWVRVATEFKIYKVGETTPVDSGTSSSTAFNFSVDKIKCDPPDAVYMIVGNGSKIGGYYHIQTEEKSAERTAEVDFGEIEVHKIGDVDLTVSNTTDSGRTAVGVVMGSGETNTDITLRVKENKGASYYGVGKYGVVFEYPKSNFTEVSISGGTKIAVPATHELSATDNSRSAYEVVANLFHYGYKDNVIIIEAKSGVNPGKNGTCGTSTANISISTLDWGTWVQDGKVMYGYVNTTSLQDVGSRQVNLSNSIRVC